MNEREIFLAALEIEAPDARTDYLKKACGDDTELLARVQALLASHEGQSEFLKTPVVEQMDHAIDGFVQTTLLNGESQNLDEQFSVDDCQLRFLEPATRENSIGRLAHYEVSNVIGQGAFGTVLKAFDEKLERVVAIKVLSLEMAATSPPRKRFLREARSSALVHHDNVVGVYAVEQEPTPYLVMEYVPGKTLQQRLDENGPLDLKCVLSIGKQIADGLAAAHAQGLIHRDIKPGNLLIDDSVNDHVKITDFGLARTADDASMTQSGVIAGTPLYMAPEQVEGQKLDQRADLFSLGSVLYQMLTGRPPFRAPTTMGVLKRVTQDTPRSIQELIPETPDWMCEIVGHLHAKDPNDRFDSAQRVSEILGQCLLDLEAGKTPKITNPAPEKACIAKEGEMTKPDRRSFDRSTWAKAAAILLVMFVGLGITEATDVTQVRSTVVRLWTGSGTLVIEANDPDVKISINGEEVTITGGGIKELTLRPGKYKISAFKDGKPIKQELVSITRAGRTVVRMSLERETLAGPSPKDIDFGTDLTEVRGEPIDLIALLDPKRDFRDNRLKVEGGKLITPRYEYPGAIGMIPCGPLPDDYDIALQLERRSNSPGAGFNFGIVVGGKQVAVGMDCGSRLKGKAWGLDFLDGKAGQIAGNPTRNPGSRLKVGKTSEVTIQVRNNHISAICDGKTLIDWTGDPQRLSLWDAVERRLTRSDCLFFFAQADFIVHKMELIPREVEANPTDTREPIDTHEFVSGEWINVLPLIDLKLDDRDIPGQKPRAGWRIEWNDLINRGGGLDSQLKFPLDSDWQSYECELEVSKVNGNGQFGITLPNAESEVPLIFNSEGQGGIILYRTGRKMTIRGFGFEPRQRRVVRFEVLRQPNGDTVKVYFDGKVAGSWSGILDDVKGSPVQQDYTQKRRLTLWVDKGGEFAFHKIRVRILDGGTAETVRPIRGRKELINPPSVERQLAGGEWIDVIPIIEPERDKYDLRGALSTGKNEWRTKNGELEVGHADGLPNKLVLPIDSDFRPGFECELEVTRRRGALGFHFNFPTGIGQTPIEFGTGNPGVLMWKPGKPKLTVVPLADELQFKGTQRSKIRIRVDYESQGDRIRIWNDGVEVGDWTGDLKELVQINDEGYPSNRRLCLWVRGKGTELIFHRIRLRKLDGGTAKTIRPVPVEKSDFPSPADAPPTAIAPFNADQAKKQQ